MEYAIQPDETIDQAIKRIYTTCVEEIIPIIQPPLKNTHRSVHETRKRLKFMRALARLIRNAVGKKLYKQQNHFFRDLARQISNLRDVHVMILVLQHVASEAHSIRQKDITKGLQKLKRRRSKLLDKAYEEQHFESIAEALTEALDSIDQLFEIEDDMTVLLPGLERVYRKGHEKFILTKNEPSDEHFHKWRKQVKYLYHHFQMLVIYWPDALDINGKSLHQLSNYLGENHDLALFNELLNGSSYGEKLTKKEAMSTYVDQKRAFLQRSALNLGEFIYARDVDEFISYFKS